jgi:hypothetical protein
VSQSNHDRGEVDASYQALVAALRDDYQRGAPEPEGEPPPEFWRQVEEEARRARVRLIALWSLIVTSLLAIVASVVWHPIIPALHCEFLDRRDIMVAGAVPTLSMLIGAALASRPSAGAQMLSRALLWSTLALASLAVIAEPGVLALASVVAALCCGTGLLLLGAHGLEPERYTGAFVPAAHREELTLVMILAVADAQTLLAWAMGSAWHYPAPGVCGVAMLIATFGLFRLRLWGLGLNLGMNLIIAVAALLGALRLPEAVVALLTTTACLQVVLSVPVFVAIGRGRPVGWPRLGRVAAGLSRVVIVAAMAAAVVGLLLADAERVAMSCIR